DGTYPSYGITGSGEDFEADGTLSADFQEYYSRETMPNTPDPHSGQTVTSASSITSGGGGWIYQESNGEIHANLLPEDNYTDDDPDWATE
ncbi:MAG: hypothetical protein ACQERZ_00770, partial [Fusobacteriota bacterium]